MSIDFSLPPDGARAREIDLRMRQSLADSLDYIGGEIAGIVDHDRAALARLVSRLQRGERLPPAVFGLYTDLVLSLDNDDMAAAGDLLEELCRLNGRQGGNELMALDDPRLRNHRDRYLRLMDTDPEVSFAMLPPPPYVASDFSLRFDRARHLVDRTMPELGREFDALVSEVIMVVGDTSAEYQFDGGSTYMLWGVLFLNVESHRGDVALVEVLAHESAHMLLFGYTRDEPLVFNDDDVLYESPLRVDLRPMDGIYHATYVSARMHWAMSRLAGSDLLDADSRDQARQALERDRENFWAGFSVVERHGELSSTGAAVMAGARRYMESL